MPHRVPCGSAEGRSARREKRTEPAIIAGRQLGDAVILVFVGQVRAAGAFPPEGPMRIGRIIARLIEPRAHGPYGDPAPFVALQADIDPPLPSDEFNWWREQLRQRGAKISGAAGSPTGVYRLNLQLPPDEVEVAVRGLLTAVDSLVAGWPDNYQEWGGARQAERTSEQERSETSSAGFQEVVDRVMSEHGGEAPTK